MTATVTAALDEYLPLMFVCLSSRDVHVSEAVMLFATEYVTRLRRANSTPFFAAHVDNVRMLLRLTANQLRFPEQFVTRLFCFVLFCFGWFF